MGGIAGIIRFDKQSVAPNDVAALQHHLLHRGAATSHLLEQGLLLAFGSSPETTGSAICCAVADADVFGKTNTHFSFSTNYENNGTAFFNELNADFAVALWDTQQQTLLCARDSMGVKPLYYVHRQGGFFAFATEIKALLALQEVTITPNKHKFREYLTWPTDYVPYSAETFYETIYSLLPGHYLRVDANGLRLQAYWMPALDRFGQLTQPADYTTLFADYFTTAIEARMPGQACVGAHLSGGLDSSSVSCVAQQLLKQQHRPSLHTFNIDTTLPSTDESRYVNAVLNQYHPTHHTVQPLTDILDSILKINTLFDRPEHFIIPSSFHLSVSIKARQIGCNYILTGHDGDSVAPTGFDYLDQLLDQQDWASLQLAVRQLVSFPSRNLQYVSDKWITLSDKVKYERYILYLVGTEITKQFKTKPLGTFIRTMHAQTQVLGLSIAAILAYCTNRVWAKISSNVLLDSTLSAAFKQQVPRQPELSTGPLTSSISSVYPVPIASILNTTNVICNEQLNHIGAYYGHQYSFPFFDKQVVELALATPLGASFDRGRGRGLIRNGLQTVLPPLISARLTKANFVEYGNLSAQQLYQVTQEQFAAPNHAIWEIIDRTAFSAIVAYVVNARIPMQKKTRYNWLLSRTIYLALWLGSLPEKGRIFTEGRAT